MNSTTERFDYHSFLLGGMFFIFISIFDMGMDWGREVSPQAQIIVGIVGAIATLMMTLHYRYSRKGDALDE